jgi:hypothetical protein
MEPEDLLRVRMAPGGLAVGDPELVESMAPPLHQAGEITISDAWAWTRSFEGDRMGGLRVGGWLFVAGWRMLRGSTYSPLQVTANGGWKRCFNLWPTIG